MPIVNIWNIFRRELVSYFNSPVSYVFIVIFLLLSGFFTFMVGDFFGRGAADLYSFFQWFPWLFLVLVPALGMHIWADEKRMGTMELLFTLPLTTFQCIVGKFLAAWSFLIFAVLLTFPIVITVAWLGKPDYGPIICGYAGCFLLGGAYLGIACMTSAMTSSQVVSFIISEVICLFLIFCGWGPFTDMLVNWAPAWLVDTAASFSVMTHFASIRRGVIDSRDIVYYCSVTAFSLFTTAMLLKNHRS